MRSASRSTTTGWPGPASTCAIPSRCPRATGFTRTRRCGSARTSRGARRTSTTASSSCSSPTCGVTSQVSRSRVWSTRWRATELSGPGIAVIGTGFGARVHVEAFRAAGFVVRALVGRDRDRTARRAERLGVRALTSVDDALALPDVDAVSIATPPHTHHRLVLDAVAAGKHVVCEKPFALDAAEAREMASAAARAGVTGFVGHEFRWATERALVARAIAEGRVGEPRLATLVSYVPLLADPAAPAPDWWFDNARGGGWLGASGSHAVDQVRVWLGEVEAVQGRLSMTSARDGRVAAADSFTALLATASGAHAVVQQTAWRAWRCWTGCVSPDRRPGCAAPAPPGPCPRATGAGWGARRCPM